MLKTNVIYNLTRGAVVCVGEVADRPIPRMRGLMGRRAIPSGKGLLLRPAPGIHTAFMRFPIDALFLDEKLRVLDVVEGLVPWRVASRAKARAVLEMGAGESGRRGVRIGDRLVLCEGAVEARRGGNGHDAGHADSASVIWPGKGEDAGGAPQALRVLVVSDDGHFRSVSAMLLGNRGCAVTATTSLARLVELAARDRVDVAVVDRGVAARGADAVLDAVQSLGRRLGVVMVEESMSAAAHEVSVLDKWGPFEELFAAVERASHERSRA